MQAVGHVLCKGCNAALRDGALTAGRGLWFVCIVAGMALAIRGQGVPH